MILTAFTAVAFPVAIQYKQGGLYWLLAPLGLLVWVVDVVANYTELALIFGWPVAGDYTISARIRRMRTSSHDSRRELAALLQTYLDACEPDGKH